MRLDLQTSTCAPSNHPNMSFTFSHSKQPPVKPPPNEEELLSARGGNQVPFAASEGSSTLEATRVYEQVKKALHRDDESFRPDISSSPSRADRTQVFFGHDGPTTRLSSPRRKCCRPTITTSPTEQEVIPTPRSTRENAPEAAGRDLSAYLVTKILDESRS
jgi:hypothetical protein